MTQNTEQNGRTRREQLASYPESVCVGRYSGDTLQLELDADDLDADRLVEGRVLYVRCDIAHRSQTEAAERGAAEQRRKDAEGYLFDNPDTGTEYLPHHPIESGECQYAANIRKATNSELLSELNAAWTGWKEDRDEKGRISANVAALEAEIAELRTEKANAGWHFLTENVSSDPEVPSCRLSTLFQEGDELPRFEQAAKEFGIEIHLVTDDREDEDCDKELSAYILAKLDPCQLLTRDGWSFVDIWENDDGGIIRLFARAALTREGGV